MAATLGSSDTGEGGDLNDLANANAAAQQDLNQTEGAAGSDDSLPPLSDEARQALARMQADATPTSISPGATPLEDDGPSTVSRILAENEDDIANAAVTNSQYAHAVVPWTPVVTTQVADPAVVSAMLLAAQLERAFGG
jgi:hypothetical protein